MQIHDRLRLNSYYNLIDYTVHKTSDAKEVRNEINEAITTNKLSDYLSWTDAN